MSYAMSGPLQAAVFNALSASSQIGALVGSAIYDAVPSGALPDLYIRLGSEDVTDASDGSGAGAVHQFTVSIITTTAGFARAKETAGAVSDALHDADLSLSRGRLVALRFEKAKAARIDSVSVRRIDLTFRARVQDN